MLRGTIFLGVGIKMSKNQMSTFANFPHISKPLLDALTNSAMPQSGSSQSSCPNAACEFPRIVCWFPRSESDSKQQYGRNAFCWNWI